MRLRGSLKKKLTILFYFLTSLNMSHHNIFKTFNNLYDAVRGDNDDFISEDAFINKIDELVDIGFIRTGPVDDFTVYQAKNRLKWADFVDIDDSIKKSILLELIENPTTFFVLQNTQKGKMRIASLELKKWGQDNTKKVVAFIIVDNDKTLADQSVDGLLRTFEGQKVKIFPLSSNSKTSFDEIKTYIDAYASDIVEDGKEPEYPMPIIALLSNPRQCEKMLRLIHHINKKVTINNSSLRYGMIWDEADKTYSQLRDKSFTIDGINLTCRTFTVEKTQALYRLGFVTATDGNLLDEDYPECANAYLYPVDISPDDQEHYRALHHPESITHRVAFTSKHTNNSYATQVLDNHPGHFMQPITLSSGETYYRKTIVNSNAKTDDMKQFAKGCNTNGMHAFVFNGYGGASVKVYREGAPVLTFKTKGKKFNEVLFYIYKELNLNDKPLVIIGRRKVDRGLGFHYCPRTNDEITLSGDYGDLVTKNKEGLIWTDEILGRIEDKDIAVQKAGRLAGIIGNSPQYPGTTHYWTDEHTEQLIRRHNTIVDKSNTNTGCSVLQAVEHAKSMTPQIKVNHRVDSKLFRVYDSEESMRNVIKEIGVDTRIAKPNAKGFIEASLFTDSGVLDLLKVIKKVPTGITSGGGKDGVKISRSVWACYKDIEDNSTLRFVVLLPPGKVSEEKIRVIDSNYPSITIPQEGEY